MSHYAAGTYVTTDRSRAEIERTLSKYGATGFGYISRNGVAAVAFEMKGRAVRLTVAIPRAEDFKTTEKGRKRTQQAAETERGQAERQRWRALSLVVKAKLEAISAGIATFEQEWLPYFITKDGQTVGEKILPELDGYLRGNMDASHLLGMDS